MMKVYSTLSQGISLLKKIPQKMKSQEYQPYNYLQLHAVYMKQDNDNLLTYKQQYPVQMI